MNKKKRITVLGGGSWGSVLASILSSNGPIEWHSFHNDFDPQVLEKDASKQNIIVEDIPASFSPQPTKTITEASSVPNIEENSEIHVEENDKNIIIKSPIIGTFYRKPSPDKPAFVEVGQTIGEGDVLCVIEAMKLFNEIESEISGKIVKILVDDKSPVEFDQPLFLIDPS